MNGDKLIMQIKSCNCQLLLLLLYSFWLRYFDKLSNHRSANAIYSFIGLINEFAVNPTKDLNEAVGGALTMRMGYVRQGQRK
jgi:hypothetical protein